ncbi:6-O-methylguanine DNA methyltransferase [Methanobrevibacter sp. 87.7]|uniref:methylated-DNA--[protein]-cysteine S-methyltransferase n=1 Tax=Methanobrevibacter sp. 87.7 TaxID=387957 RepID=UPI000B5089B4|nr:methylated-DNA--[protein]-cysteine S-methyltransferase [Methanobrevibacter sp. 87.7]OWT33700.1 6-O-methylguanine DNA methyltransferase [Methanobrevibacter sp. 87.7]
MDIEYKVYTIKNTIIGDISIVFNNEEKDYIKRIFLSNPDLSSETLAFNVYDELEVASDDDLTDYLKKLVSDIKAYLNGEDVEFKLDNLDLNNLTKFQYNVLMAEYHTHKNEVNTYKDLAKLAGSPKAYRAVGNVLAKNPFPIIIPCHRTVKSDNSIGGFNGFQAGIKSKAILLKLDGVYVDERKVVSKSPIISKDENQTKFNIEVVLKPI